MTKFSKYELMTTAEMIQDLMAGNNPDDQRDRAILVDLIEFARLARSFLAESRELQVRTLGRLRLGCDL